MDWFTSMLKAQTIYLDAYDDMSSTSTVPFYFWYKRAVPEYVLEAAFYRTLGEFPILAGHIKTDRNMRSFVAVDKNHLNMPEYTDILCGVHYNEFENADFDTSLLPVDCSAACKTPVPSGVIGGRLKLATFCVFRLKDNSGMCIFASVFHAILDGKGYYEFMKRWADISKQIANTQMHNEVLDINNIPALRFEHNRSVLETDKHAGCDALEPELRKTSKCSTMASWIAWISPELRGRIFHYLLSSRRTRNYYHRISEAGYKRLYQTVLPYASPDVSHLSANDVITALATVLFAQAFHKAGRIDGATDFMTNIMLDIRPRVKRLSRANYVGNALLIKEATNPLDILLQESAAPQALATVACSIRRAVNSVDERYCNQLGYMFNNARCSYVDMLLQITKTKNTFVCTNHTRFKYYEMDFGNGVPVLVRPSFLVFENDFVIMPAHPDVGGFELAFTTVPEVAKHIDDSKYWQFC